MPNPSESGEDDMKTVEYSQVIDRQVSDVFEFMAEQHVQNHPKWDPNIELELESEGPIGVGTVIRRRNTRYEEPVEGTIEITEFEPNESFGSVIREGGFEMSGRITFEEVGPSQTRVTRSATIPASIDEALIQREMERTAQNIEELIESEY
jgi:hypothetical protein